MSRLTALIAQARNTDAKDSVYRWIENRSLPAHKIGRLWKFNLSEVDKWVRAAGAEAEHGADKRGTL